MSSRKPEIRKGQGVWPLPVEEIQGRFQQNFSDPNFDAMRTEIARLARIASQNYKDSRKAPRTRKAGAGFADPNYELSVEWLATREAIQKAAQEQADPARATRVLLICAASRNDKTCPGEMSKTYRLTMAAQEVFQAESCEVDLLDLSALTSDYRKFIHPCKACVSTAMPLCHWPCSCYPNHGLGQVNDWMNELYTRWVAAHAVMIVTPVYWYQVPSGLKSMMDRLVCADGGNPDPTSTHGKKPEEAKALELEGWKYPRHLAGRVFGVVTHGDAEGADIVRRSLSDWLSDMRLIAADGPSAIDRYIGYYEPYATSHEALDADVAMFKETRNVARSIARTTSAIRRGDRKLIEEPRDPRPK